MYTFTCTSTQHAHTMNTPRHTHIHGHVYRSSQPGGGTPHRPTARGHFTHSSEHLSCAVQTLRDPCPFSTCSSESHRAAVSGDPSPRALQLPVCKGFIPAAGVEVSGVRQEWWVLPLPQASLGSPEGHPAAAGSYPCALPACTVFDEAGQGSPGQGCSLGEAAPPLTLEARYGQNRPWGFRCLEGG